MRLNIVPNGLWTKIIHKPLCKIHTSYIIYVKTGAVLVFFFSWGMRDLIKCEEVFCQKQGQKGTVTE